MTRRLAAVIVAVGVVAVACSTPARTAPSVPHIFDLNDDPAAVVAPVASDERISVQRGGAHLIGNREEDLGFDRTALTCWRA